MDSGDRKHRRVEDKQATDIQRSTMPGPKTAKSPQDKEKVRKAGAEFAKKQTEKLFAKSNITDNSVSAVDCQFASWAHHSQIWKSL